MSRTYHLSEAKRAERAARMKALNADPRFKARMKALNADPRFKARMKALNADPRFKAQASARMKALHADPRFKAQASARMKALHADPRFKARMRLGADKRIQGLSARQLKVYWALRDRGVEDYLALREAIRRQSA